VRSVALMAECCQRLKDAVRALKRELIALYYASRDDDCPCIVKVIAVVAIAYALSPIDLIPDFIPVLGLLDDLVLLPLLLGLAIRLMPAELLARARARATSEPLELSKNVPAAICFGLLWLGCLLWLVSVVIHRWRSPDLRQYEGALMIGCAAVYVLVFALCLRRALVKKGAAPPLPVSTEPFATANAQLREPLLVGSAPPSASSGTTNRCGYSRSRSSTPVKDEEAALEAALDVNRRAIARLQKNLQGSSEASCGSQARQAEAALEVNQRAIAKLEAASVQKLAQLEDLRSSRGAKPVATVETSRQ